MMANSNEADLIRLPTNSNRKNLDKWQKKTVGTNRLRSPTNTEEKRWEISGRANRWRRRRIESYSRRKTVLGDCDIYLWFRRIFVIFFFVNNRGLVSWDITIEIYRCSYSRYLTWAHYMSNHIPGYEFFCFLPCKIHTAAWPKRIWTVEFRQSRIWFSRTDEIRAINLTSIFKCNIF